METRGTFHPSADSLQNFGMINVEEKMPTRRRAVASGRLLAAPETIARIRGGTLPKGNALALAEAAGIMAAKRTADILPLCHPLPLDSVRFLSEFDSAGSLTLSCEVIATAKTGVEMEALCGVQAALLCVYDLTKGVDPALSIEGIHLNLKEGGKSGVWVHPKNEIRSPVKSASLTGLRAVVLTLSDRCSSGESEDRSGPDLVRMIENNGGTVLQRTVLPDDLPRIVSSMNHLLNEHRPDFVVCTGGTGIGPRDVTPEAIDQLGGRWIVGLGELLRSSGARFTSKSWLSRGGVYQSGSTLIVLLPGSPTAVAQGMEVLTPLIPHAIRMMRGEGHP